MTTTEYRSRYASTEASDYEFACHVADCHEVSHEVEDFHKCESCAVLLCDEHAHRMFNDPTPFCEACAKCSCGQYAAFWCDECGTLVCWNCVYRHDDVHESLFGGISITKGYFCRTCFQQTEDSPVQVESEEPCGHHMLALMPTQLEADCPF